MVGWSPVRAAGLKPRCRLKPAPLQVIPMRREKVYPVVRALLEEAEVLGAPAMETLSPEEARRAAIDALAAVALEPVQVDSVQDLRVPVPVRIYTPTGPGPFACLVYFHGGGWVVCDLDTHDSICRA